MKHARADYDRIQDPAGLIPEDEPVFILRGQDIYAAAAVEFYAGMVEAAGGDPEIVRLSREQILRMRNWPKRKMPDITQTQQPTPIEELTPHRFVPTKMRAGVCAECGHLQGYTIHSSFRLRELREENT